MREAEERLATQYGELEERLSKREQELKGIKRHFVRKLKELETSFIEANEDLQRSIEHETSQQPLAAQNAEAERGSMERENLEWISKREAEIRELVDRNKATMAENEKLTAQIEKRAEQERSLSEMVTSIKNEKTGLLNEVREKTGAISALEIELKQTRTMIKQLEDVVDEKSEQAAELQRRALDQDARAQE